MKRALSRTLASVGLGLAAIVIAPTHAQTTGVGPYYATPSWDQTLPAATRFIVLTNFNSEAVLDRETGVVWARTVSETAQSRGEASNKCNGSRVGGRYGWRLPSIQELMSLGDALVSGAHPFVVPIPIQPTNISLFHSITGKFPNEQAQPGVYQLAISRGSTGELFAGAQTISGGDPANGGGGGRSAYVWCSRSPIPGADVQ